MRLLLLHVASNFMELLQVSCVCSCKKMENQICNQSQKKKKEMLIINGNAFYEIDLECVKKKTMCSDSAPGKENRQGSIPGI